MAWSQDSPNFLLVFTVIYAVVVIVAVTDQKNTRPGAEHGPAAWGDVFRLNKFYMDKRGPNLLLTQHFHIGIDGYKQMLWAWFKSEILCPKRLVFKSDSYYYEAMQSAIRAGMKRKRGKPMKKSEDNA